MTSDHADLDNGVFSGGVFSGGVFPGGSRLALALMMPLLLGCCQPTRASDQEAGAPGVVDAQPEETYGQEDERNRLARLNQETARAFDDKRYIDALRLGEEAYQLGLEKAGGRHPATMLAGHQLAQIYVYVERLDQAEALYRETLDNRRAVLGARHDDTLRTMFNLADLYKGPGSLRRSRAAFRGGAERPSARHSGSVRRVTQITLDQPGRHLLGLEASETDAEPLYRRLLEVRRARRSVTGMKTRVTR